MSKFLWVGNWPAIDFINTDIVVEGKPVDLLDNPDDVVDWLQESRLCEGIGDHALPKTKHLLGEARAYRALLKGGIADLVNGRRVSAKAIDKTNAYLRRCVSSQHVQAESGGYRSITTWSLRTAEDCLVPIAASFAKLVTETDPARIRKCKNPECVLYFYDTSKGGQRAWCSLDICGNKLRMAASRSRRDELGAS